MLGAPVDFRRIYVIVHRSTSDKLAVACLGLSLIPVKERGRLFFFKGFQSKICELVSGKLSKCLYIHGYTHLITSSALSECR